MGYLERGGGEAPSLGHFRAYLAYVPHPKPRLFGVFSDFDGAN